MAFTSARFLVNTVRRNMKCLTWALLALDPLNIRPAFSVARCLLMAPAQPFVELRDSSRLPLSCGRFHIRRSTLSLFKLSCKDRCKERCQVVGNIMLRTPEHQSLEFGSKVRGELWRLGAGLSKPVLSKTQHDLPCNGSC